MIGVHDSGFRALGGSRRGARRRWRGWASPIPVVVDVEHEIWQLYGNLGWPARYLFNQDGKLFDYHYGEGGYEETELAIQELLGIERPTLAPLRPEDAPGALLAPQSEDVDGPYSGPYEAGARVGRARRHRLGHRQRTQSCAVDHPGCYELIAHPRSTAGELELAVGDGVRCYAVCFTPGLARVTGSSRFRELGRPVRRRALTQKPAR